MGCTTETLWVLKCLSWAIVSSTSKERVHCLSPLLSPRSLEVARFRNNEEGLGYFSVCRFIVILGTRSETFWYLKCREISKRLEFPGTCFSIQQPLEIHTRAYSEKKGSSKLHWFQHMSNEFRCRLSHISILASELLHFQFIEYENLENLTARIRFWKLVTKLS